MTDCENRGAQEMRDNNHREEFRRDSDHDPRYTGSDVPTPKSRNERQLDAWALRRRVIYLTMLFCASVISYGLYKGGDGRVIETAVMSAFGLLATVVVAYCFAATWDDTNKQRSFGDRGGRR